MREFFVIPVLVLIYVGCVLSPLSGVVTVNGTFLLAAVVAWFASAVLAASLHELFGRPTNGTSGKLGVAFLWIIVRLLLAAVITALGVASVMSYTMALCVSAAIYLVLDALLILC